MVSNHENEDRVADDKANDEPHQSEPQTERKQNRIALNLPDDDGSDVDEFIYYGSVSDVENFHGGATKHHHRRLRQSLRWTWDLDLRLSSLEEDVDKIKGHDGRGSAASQKARRWAKDPKHHQSIKVMSWDDFKAPPAPKGAVDTPGSKHKLRIDPRQGYVIEVLAQEPNFSLRKPATRTPAEGGPQDGSSPSSEADSAGRQSGSSRSTWSKAPPRMRIRSRSLLAHLSDICNGEFNIEPGKMVFLRPYKLFCLYENEIRARYHKLKYEFRDALAGTPREEKNGQEDASEEDNKTEEEPLTTRSANTDGKDSAQALRHFELLIEFLDQYLKPLFDFRTSLMNGEVKKIAFDDLWHLFKLGQEVWVPNKQDEKAGIYKVLKYTGGRELLTQKYGPPSHPISQDLGPGGWSGAFAVQCWNLAFDGDVYRPMLKTFGIRRFDGEKEITSLPIYPLGFDPEHDDIRKQFVSRGEKFLKYTESKNIHLRYLGPDCDENARGEQVRF